MSDWDYLVGDDEPDWRELAGIARRRAEAAEAERDRLQGLIADYQRTYNGLDADLGNDEVDTVDAQFRDWKAAQTALLDIPTAGAEEGT